MGWLSVAIRLASLRKPRSAACCCRLADRLECRTCASGGGELRRRVLCRARRSGMQCIHRFVWPPLRRRAAAHAEAGSCRSPPKLACVDSLTATGVEQ